MKQSLFIAFISFFCLTAKATTYSAYTVVSTSNNQSIYVQVDDVANQVKLILSGNASKYMAFGFNATNMSGGTYTINTNGVSVQERTLGGYSAGSVLTSSFVIKSDVTSGGIRTVTLTRDLAGISPAYFNFTPAASAGFSLPIIWAHGSGTNFAYHQSRGATTLVFAQDCYTPINDIVSACGNSFTGPTGAVYTADGVYVDTSIVVNGCDFIYTTDLTFAQPTTFSISVAECTSYTVPSGNQTYTTAGVFTDTLVNAAGCDSIITISLTLNATENAIVETVCETYTVPSGNATYTTSGVYTDVLQNAAGCDSILTIDLTVNQPTTSSEIINTCGEYVSNGTTYTSSGTYTQVLTNANGCDSILTIELTLSPLDAIVTLSADELTASTTTQVDSYQWINCTSTLPLAGETETTFMPVDAGEYAVVLTQGTCLDTSDCLAIEVANIEENTSDLGVSIFPNPTTDYIMLKFNETVTGKITIRNVLGETITELNLINSLEEKVLIEGTTGLYLLEISTKNKNITRRVIKR